MCCACRRPPRHSLNRATVSDGSNPAADPALKCEIAVRRCSALSLSWTNRVSVCAISASDTRPSAFATYPSRVKVVSKNCARIRLTASGPDNCRARHSPRSKAWPSTRPNNKPTGPNAKNPMAPAKILPVTCLTGERHLHPAAVALTNCSDPLARVAECGTVCTATDTAAHYP